MSNFSSPPPPYDYSNDPYSKRVPTENEPVHGRANPYVVPIMVDVNIDQIESYMIWSVLNVFCCCFCFGLLACFYSSETNNAKSRGDLLAALNASRSARTINIVGTILGIIITINYIIYQSGGY